MRALGVLAGVLVLSFATSCASDGTGGLMGQVFGQVATSATQTAVQRGMGSIVSSPTVSSATQQLCGSDLWGLCHNMTASMLSGFTDEFVKKMSQEDVRQATVAREQAIQSGQTQSWSNPQTGASGTVQTQPAPPRPPAPVAVKAQKDRVGTPPEMDAVGERYVVTGIKGANVRGGPGTTYPVVESLPANEQVMAIGKVKVADWYMVGRGDVAIGYVAGSLIKRADAAAVAAPPTATPAATTPPATPAANVEEVQVVMAAECYTTKQKVTLGDGTSQEATVTSCRTPNGWAQV